MRTKILVASVANEVWFQGKRDERSVVILNCLDAEAHLGMKIKQTFDYNPTEAEAHELNLQALDGQIITLAVSDVKASTGGRLKLRGQIDRSSLPKGVLVEKAPTTSKAP